MTDQRYTIVGQQHLERAQRDAWFAIRPGDRIKLVRTPDNPKDKNAIEVHAIAGLVVEGQALARDTKVGFIKATEAAVLAPWLDAGHGRDATVVFQKPNTAVVST
jgi:hypothetical protein